MEEYEKIDIRKLAARIYDLDQKVYSILGSSLGRVYNGDKEHNLSYITDLLESKKGANILRAEVALIGNMAKTIESTEERADVLDELASIIKLTRWQSEHYTRIDILDPSRAQLNAMPLKTRFSEQDKKIICIGRNYGCGGNEIGFNLAQELNLNYYDKAMFDEIMKRMETGQTSVWDDSYLYDKSKEDSMVYQGEPFAEEPKMSIKQIKEDFSRYHGLPKRDALFFSQSRLITDLAKRENFVIMGRYADIVLTNEKIPHVSIFISAPFEKRVERMKAIFSDMTEKQVRSMLQQSDDRHARDYKYFTGKEWGAPCNYDLTVNSASYGIPGSVALIIGMLESEIDYS